MKGIFAFFALALTGLSCHGALPSDEGQAGRADDAIAAIRAEGYATTMLVSSVEELMATENRAKSGDVEFVIADGTYYLTKSLYITGKHVCYRSASGDRSKVVLRGNGMSGSVYGAFQVAGDDFRVFDLSLGDVRYHGIQVHGESDADGFAADNIRLFDCREQMIKGSIDMGNQGAHADRGIVSRCVFEYSAGKAYQYYCGGIDVHRGVGWKVVDCEFKGIASPETRLTEGAIHFWNDSEGTIVERNKIVNCDRGVLFGMDASPHRGGRITNNFICVSRDVGIYLCDARGAVVAHNTIYVGSSYPNAIEYRFDTSGCDIRNNVANRAIVARNGGTAKVANNVTDAQSEWFASSATGDLHLVGAIPSIVDRGVAIVGIGADIDGQERSGTPDLGADELE
jgi:hypothetical protein